LILKKYYEVCERVGWEPRYFIIQLFELLEEALNQDDKRLFLVDLPAGYGKSTATITLASLAIEGNPYFSRIIHVLPMRSIIDDLYIRVKKSLNKFYDSRVERQIAAQYMFSPGSPLFAKKCVITTLDSFILNFFKLPAHELAKAYDKNIAHFEFPRSMIYTSLVIFDEFHLFTGLGSLKEERKSLTAVLATIISLLEAGVSVIVMTATMPLPIKRIIQDKLRLHGYSQQSIEYASGLDSKFDEALRKKVRRIKKVDQVLPRELKDYRGKRVALVMNSVKRAIDLYKHLKQELDEEVILAHGHLPESKRTFLKDIGMRQSYFVVATQVIEAGIDLDFDLMVTECCPADRLVQRAGRVARHRDEGELWVLPPYEHQPYDPELIRLTWDGLKDGENLTYERSRELIELTYNKLPNLELNLRLFNALRLLDTIPIFGLKEAKEAFEYFAGFTDSAGIISAYKEGDYEPRNAIPISEGEARNILSKGSSAKFLMDGRGTVREVNIRKLGNRPLFIQMLREGYRGIVLDEDEYFKLMGLDGL
jgi:CRISPR-associated endonuclease/helicase Cas3